MAEHLGFCWGVERAVAMAMETRLHFPEETLHITNEIIHNPQVNEKLTDMGVNVIPKEAVGEARSPEEARDEEREGAAVRKSRRSRSKIKEGDVVILPAFGASLEEMQLLDDKGVKVVDATCPWVSKVWNTVDKHIRADATSIIHGKWNHEETIATASFAERYVIVKNLEEAQYVADYIVNGGNKEEFLEKFKNAMSEGFDPDTDLKKLGLANQTTMYKRETRQIGRIMEKAIMAKYGAAEEQQLLVLEHLPHEKNRPCTAVPRHHLRRHPGKTGRHHGPYRGQIHRLHPHRGRLRFVEHGSLEGDPRDERGTYEEEQSTSQRLPAGQADRMRKRP
eukprot:scaffold145_cov261-Pinguiococcus_pyrenoidosus.AAC.21